MMESKIHIRQMQLSDIEFAVQLTRKEGWKGQEEEIVQAFLNYDPRGCLIAENKGNRIGMCIATGYHHTGFVGELIVIKNERGKGIGRGLLNRSISYLGKKNIKSIYLDGVPSAVPLYEKTGFRKVCRSLRFSGQVQATPHPQVRQMRMEDFYLIGQIDAKVFGDDRTFFLNHRFTRNPGWCYVMERDGSIVGFIFAKKVKDFILIGPWWMQPDVQSPEALLTHLASKAQNRTLRIGVLETNVKAIELLRSLSLKESADPPWRMVHGPKGNLGMSDQLYAIGSAAKG